MLDCKYRGFCIEGIENGFDQDDVNATFNQCARGPGVGLDQLIKTDITETRVVDIGRYRGRAIRRAKYAGNETRFVRCFCSQRICRLACNACRGEIDLKARSSMP